MNETSLIGPAYELQSMLWIAGPKNKGGHRILDGDYIVDPTRVLIKDPFSFGFPEILIVADIILP